MKLHYENWKPIPGFRNYEVSNFGEIRNSDTGRILSPGDNGKGYLYVNLYDENHIPRRFYVHRLVAMAFHEFGSDMEVNHDNGLKTINFAHNLYPVTREENIQHAYDTGLMDPSTQRANVRPVRVIETGEIYESAEACARALGFAGGNVRRVLRGDLKHLRGYTFEYANEVLV